MSGVLSQETEGTDHKMTADFFPLSDNSSVTELDPATFVRLEVCQSFAVTMHLRTCYTLLDVLTKSRK